MAPGPRLIAHSSLSPSIQKHLIRVDGAPGWKLRYGRNKVLHLVWPHSGGRRKAGDRQVNTHSALGAVTDYWGYSWVRGLDGRHGDRVVCR